MSDISRLEIELNKNSNFNNIMDLNIQTLDKTGFYCIRLKNGSKLPEKYQQILEKRKYKFIYIGKAEKQNLANRLDQELKHKKPGTFFRSIGCVLEYLPIKGHLKGKANQNNYKFSITDTNKITNWLIENTEINIISYSGNFDVESELIRKYQPLLNDTHNPLRLQELKEDKEYCRSIARG